MTIKKTIVKSLKEKQKNFLLNVLILFICSFEFSWCIMFVFCVFGEFWVLRLLVGRDTKNDRVGEKKF